MKKITGLFLSLFVGITLSFGQQQPALQQQTPPQETIEVSDAELTKFVNALEKVQELNNESQAQMLTAVKSNDLSVERFNEIHQDSGQESDVTPIEMENFSQAVKKIQAIQVETQQKMQNEIMECGISVERYQEILVAVQTSPELLARVQDSMN